MELKTGEIYRGELHEAEDNWNVQLINVQATARDGKVRRRGRCRPAHLAGGRVARKLRDVQYQIVERRLKPTRLGCARAAWLL